MSLAYLDQESPMKDQDYKRYTVNMNGEIQATDFLKVGMGINVSHSIKIMVLLVIFQILQLKTLMVWRQA